MYKEHKIVMLPSNIEANLGDIFKLVEEYKYMDPNFKVGSLMTNFNKNVRGNNENYKLQHLYILSDDEIDNPSWFYNPQFNSVSIKNDNAIKTHKGCKKIIASTDKSLQLPGIDKTFIQSYIESNGNIDSVNVRYETAQTKSLNDTVYEKLEVINNNIVIKTITEKFYTKSQVLEIIKEAFYNTGYGGIQVRTYPDGSTESVKEVEKWLDQYLLEEEQEL